MTLKHEQTYIQNKCSAFFKAFILFAVLELSLNSGVLWAQSMVLTDNMFMNIVKYYAKNGDIERALLELKKLQELYPENKDYQKYEQILRTEYARGFKSDNQDFTPSGQAGQMNDGSISRNQTKKAFAKLGDRGDTDNQADLPPDVIEKNKQINKGRLRYVYELIGRGEQNQAISKLREILSTEPNFIEASQLLGELYLNKKNFEEAINFFKKSLSLRQDAETNYKVGLCYKNINDINNAIIHFDIAARMNPKHEMANLNLGNIMRFRKNFRSARSYYEQTLRANQNCVEAHLGMADCIYNEVSLEEATKAYAFIITTFPGEYSAYLGLSRILIQNKQLNEAKAVVQKAKELAPNNSQVHEMLGVLSYNLKDSKSAIENFKRAIMADGTNQTAYESLINILIDEKKYDDALTQIKACASKFPANPRLYYLSGVIYSGYKNTPLALKNLLEAYKLEPNNIETVLALAILYENTFKYKESVEKYREAVLLANEKKDMRFANSIQNKIDVLEKKIEKYYNDKQPESKQ